MAKYSGIWGRTTVNQKYGCDDKFVGHYNCQKINEPITIDGNLNKEVWRDAEKSPRFVDMVTGIPGFLGTKCAAVWDDAYLYVAFWIDEPNITAHYKNRDDLIYLENDIEIFIDGEDCYYEFQINALGTVYEVFYIWQNEYTQESRFNTDEFDLIKRNVDVIGGFQDVSRFEKHPRGARWAFSDWDMEGLKSAVTIDGSLNDPSKIDNGWMAEIAFPWKSMTSLMGVDEVKFKAGDTLRMDFSRFEALSFNGHIPNINPGWSFNRHGVYDSHIPEVFTYVHLTE
jgi:cellulose/xylan binding protein with CBM9 domain